MNIECVSDKALEDVSGGFSYDTLLVSDIMLSQEEFNELKNEKIIGDDGKIHLRDVEKAFDFLKKKGYVEEIRQLLPDKVGVKIVKCKR